MDPRLARVAPRVYTLYAWVFVLFGAVGALTAHLEPSLLHGLILLPEQRPAMTGLLNQMRFLRALELGFGLVMLTHRDAFFARAPRRSDINKAVLAGLLAAPAARTLSLVMDGPPAAGWTGVLVVEWMLFLWLRGASAPRPRNPERV